MVASMINHCVSDLARVTFWNGDSLLKTILSAKVISQSAMSRFLNGFSEWQEFTRLRILRLQEDPELKLEEGDVIACGQAGRPRVPAISFVLDKV